MTEPSSLPGNAGPLSGFRVIDLTTNVLGPVATQILGDMGADIIKVEAPEGDHTRHVGPSRSEAMGVFFLNINRNKRSIVLDLKKQAAREALFKLVETADVFVHSMRPDAAKRLGIGYKDMAALNPQLVYASASGYRPQSSRRNWPAFDDVIQGLSGIAAMNARTTGEPRYFPTVLADKHCGYVLSSAISMALLWRERTGEGQEVHVPMMESMVSFNMMEHLWGAVLDEPERGVGYSRMFTPHRRPYATKDGYICLLANTDEQWRRLFALMDRPDMADDPRYAKVNARSRNIDAVYAVVAEQMAKRTTGEWRQLLDAADIPNGPVQDFDDLLNDPYLGETRFFQRVAHPTEGKFVTTAIPVEFSKSGGTIRRLAPQLGEHTREVLEGCGMSESEIAALSEATSIAKVLVKA